MTELRQGFITTQKSPQVKIHYVESNHRDHNPLIIFLHGFPEHWYSWRSYLQAVAEEGYHGIALDLRGYNESSKPPEVEAYRIDILVNDVKEIIKTFGNKTTFLVGHDWGGFIALELARRYPEVLNGIVLMNGPIEMTLKRGNFLALEELFINMAHERKFLTGHEIEIYKEAMEDPVSIKAAINYYRANPFIRPLRHELKIAVPGLFIWGGEDVTLVKKLTESMEQFFSEGLTKRFYPHSTHWVHLEHPKEIQNELIYFFSLNRLRGHKNMAVS